MGQVQGLASRDQQKAWLGQNALLTTGVEEALSEYVLWTWTQPCQRPQHLRPMAMAKPFLGGSESNGKAFLWAKSESVTMTDQCV